MKNIRLHDNLTLSMIILGSSLFLAILMLIFLSVKNYRREQSLKMKIKDLKVFIESDREFHRLPLEEISPIV